jgi:glycopeptide antibiotics resistance protein
MAPYLMIALPIILIVRFIHYFSKRKTGFQTTFFHEILLILYFLFLVGLASQTIFPDFVNGPDGLKIVESEVQRFNLVPFNKIKEIKNAIMYDNVDYVIIEVFGNIGIFVIIGFLTPLLWKRYEKMTNTVGFSFLISLFIETTQIFLPRATDVDDLIMNTLGGLIGYILYLLVKKGFPRFSERCKAYNKIR